MTTYSTEELVSSSVISKNFWAYLSKISNNEIDKIWVLKNNKLDAVIISIETYDFFQELYEHIEIYNSIKDRLNNNDFIDWNTILKNFWISV
jgi:PHD/YefM family antitoxin component YafN of YafNO toxin-antitoxin module